MKVKIGSNYQPKFFERRTSDTYQALNPAMSDTNYKLQKALINEAIGNTEYDPDRFVMAVAVIGIVAIVACLFFGVL